MDIPLDTFILGFKKLDEQHHDMLYTLAYLHEDLVNNNLPFDEIKKRVLEMYASWKQHEEYEEGLMTNTCFPLRKQHEIGHQIYEAYFKMLLNFPNKHTANDMLGELGKHILRYDTLYVKHFKEHNIT